MLTRTSVGRLILNSQYEILVVQVAWGEVVDVVVALLDSAVAVATIVAVEVVLQLLLAVTLFLDRLCP